MACCKVFPKARLVVSAGLFLGWIGYLAYLVARTRDPVILSRPQFLAADAVIHARVKEVKGRGDAGVPAATVDVIDVLWSAKPVDLKGKPLTLDDLPDCGPEVGWRGAADYLLPLSATAAGYQVTPLPYTPGFHPGFDALELKLVGPHPDKVVPLIAQLTGWDEAKCRGFHQGILRRNVHRYEFQELVNQLKSAGARLDWISYESRIHRATPEALAQWEEIKPASP